MNKKTTILLGLLVLLLGVAFFLYQSLGAGYRGTGPTAVTPTSPTASAAPEGQGAGEPQENRVEVPSELSFTDRDGNTVTMADLVGKPTVINFWATWCVYCRKEMPDFLTVYRELGDEVQFVMLNVVDPSRGETHEVAKKYFVDNKLEELPLYFDEFGLQMSQAFGASGLPMTFFIDSEGYLVAYEPGMTNIDRLRSGIEMIRSAPVTIPTAATIAISSQEEEEMINPSWCTIAPEYRKVDAESAKNMIDEFQGEAGLVILDVRTEAEFQEEHIPKAVLIPHDEVSARATAELPNQRDVILVYCRTGRRSEEAAKALVALGYNHVYDMGGIVDWPYETIARKA